MPGADLERSPCCFMHIPKSGGMSFNAALEAALPAGSLAPWRMDSSTFCGFCEFDLLGSSVRDLIAADGEEMRSLRRYRAVSGHFSLTSLLQIATAPAIGTVLREPRARAISLYVYWRTPKLFDQLLPYSAHEHARGSLDQFLVEPRVAPAIDNQVCRMVLHGDARIPHKGFIAEADVEAIAADAIALLDTLGFVGVLELGSSAWNGLAELFGVSLEPQTVNVTGETCRPVAAPAGARLFTAETLQLLEQRNAADQIVYSYALSLQGMHEREGQQIAESALAAQLVRLGDLLGSSAARLAEQDTAGRHSGLEVEID